MSTDVGLTLLTTPDAPESMTREEREALIVEYVRWYYDQDSQEAMGISLTVRENVAREVVPDTLEECINQDQVTLRKALSHGSSGVECWRSLVRNALFQEFGVNNDLRTL